MTTSTAVSNNQFDRNQCKEFIGRVENDLAEFIGHEYQVARIVGYISGQHELGELSNERASQLLKDVTHLGRLAGLGQRFGKMVRNPPAEVRILVLADERKRS